MSETKMQVAEKSFQEMTSNEMVQSAKVQNKFVSLYQTLHGKGDGLNFYQAESFHFLKLVNESRELSECEKMSLYGCFLDVAVNGLSFDPGMKQVYLVPYGVNLGTKESPRWIKRAQLMISPYGELQMRIRSGQIKYADNPVLVFEGDHFIQGTRNGQVFVEHAAQFPRKSEKVIACYVRLERADGSFDFKVMSIEEILKLKASSKAQNSAAWTTHLNGMIQAKTLKHAFKSYPRVRLRGQFSKIEEDENGNTAIDYDIEQSERPQIEQTASSNASNGKITPNTAANGNGQISPAAQMAAATMTMDNEGGRRVDETNEPF
jgi:phage RecT family recombinase